MTRSGLKVVLTSLVALSALATGSAAAQNTPATRVIKGIVRDSLTQKPLGRVEVYVERDGLPAHSPPEASADSQGRFRLLAASSPFVLCVWVPRLPAKQIAVAGGTDSTLLEITFLTYRSHGPPTPSAHLSPDAQRAIWTALLVALAAPTEAGCLAEPQLPATNPYEPPVSQPAVLDLDSLAPNAMRDSVWHQQLIRDKVVVAVCEHAKLDACGQRGFRMYYRLSAPTQYAADSASVRVDWLSEAIDLCKVHGASWSAGFDQYVLYRVGSSWAYGGEDFGGGEYMVASGTCRPSDTLPAARARQPN